MARGKRQSTTAECINQTRYVTLNRLYLVLHFLRLNIAQPSIYVTVSMIVSVSLLV